MNLTHLMPHLAGCRVEEIRAQTEQVTLVVRLTRRTARCPVCARRSRRVHSWYQRTVADLPLAGRPLVLWARVRRFRCANRTCPRAIFAERWPRVAPVRARRTPDHQRALEHIAFALGGAAGARLAGRLGIAASRATLLRLVRAAPPPADVTPRVLGVDDWAWRRGQRYGTLLLDLEQHRPIDLLPDRTAERLAKWLIEHPGVEVISRDRAGAYADGSRQGAPDAVQVADRYHLLANVGEALERVLGSQRPALQEAAAAVDRLSLQCDRSDGEIPTVVEPGPVHSAPNQPKQRPQRGERLARYEAVMALHQQGWSQSAISRHLGLERKTIRRYLRANGFPERARPAVRSSILAPSQAYLRSRWIAGCHNAHTLWQEISEQGFPGGDAIVRRHLATWRTRPARQGFAAHRVSAEELGCPPAPQRTRVLSPRQARWLLLRTWEELRPEEQSYRTQLLDGYPAIREAQRLAEDFGHLVRQRDRSALDPWLARAKASALPEFRSFAAGLCRDRPAVEAALTLEWSNGATEGHINRLKYLKRQMFGRAGFALLRQRVLRAA